MAEDFKIGDVVQLKSGGPKMTVTSVGTDHYSQEPVVSCVWFAENKESRGKFPPDALRKTE
jgi:uncharacterized protein YodC (DUF2158 family)